MSLGGSAKKAAFSSAMTEASTERSERSTQSNSRVQVNSSGGIVKTVILPYDEINNLKAEVEYLKTYKQAQK